MILATRLRTDLIPWIQFRSFHAQRLANFLQVGVVEQCAMTDYARSGHILRVSGYLAAFGQDVVAPAQLSWHAQIPQHLDHRCGKFLKIREIAADVRRDKAEIQISRS